MNPERFEEISREGGLICLNDRAKWILRGPDRVRYLNGQVTNNVKTASDAQSVYACVTNVKGRIEGDVFIHTATAPGSSDPVLVVDAEAGLREPLGMRLERYIIADDVELIDVTEEWQLWHAFGQRAAVLQEMTLPERAHLTAALRFGREGVDLWWPVSAGAPPVPPDVNSLSAEEVEVWRIVAGVPRWPAELNAETFPPEAGLQQRGMDYAKGCYIGQEILSRIKTTGKMPQTLVQVKSRAGEAAQVPMVPGAVLYTRQEDGTLSKAGHVTSTTRHPLCDQEVGLAYVKQALAGAHSLLLAPEEPPKITFEVDILIS